MYHHHLNHNSGNLFSSRPSFPSERNLFLQAGNGPGDSKLVLSTDAKPRLKWTPELHERFLEAVNQLGGAEKATPKAVMRLMGIPGLTLYHLKSHLQKYRLSKNPQAQTASGVAKNVLVPSVALDRRPEESQSFDNSTNVGTHGNKTVQINEALQMQMEVQWRIHKQLEVQRHLQRRIEAQGKYLQSVLEKAQETLGTQNLSSAGLETAKAQLTELVSEVSNECLSSTFPGFEEARDSHFLQKHVAHIANHSIDSCVTSCEGSKKEHEMQDMNMALGAYHGNLSLRIQAGWCEDPNGHRMFSRSNENYPTHCSLPASRSFNILALSKPDQTETKEGNNNQNSYLKQGGNKRYAIQQKSSMSSSDLELPCASQLDLNVSDEYKAAKNCHEFDLNGFGWS